MKSMNYLVSNTQNGSGLPLPSNRGTFVQTVVPTFIQHRYASAYYLHKELNLDSSGFYDDLRRLNVLLSAFARVKAEYESEYEEIVAKESTSLLVMA